MKIRILTDEDGNILAFTKTGGVEWQEIDVKDEELDELSADLRHFKLENGRLQKTDSYRISLMEKIRNELYELRLTYETAPFEFEKNGIKYLQNNRSIDQSNLTRIVVMCQAKQKNTFENWKFYTKEGSEKYESLTLLDMMKMAEIMEKQTTLAMVTETWLNHELETLADTELKNYESETRYKQKYNEIKEV